MTATVTKSGPYYSSGPISFSTLRGYFKETVSGSIKASEIRRNTQTTDINPVVPDSTENSNISASSNLKLSQFRNSIKYYYITQTGTDLNFDIDAQSWNGNLNKNIVKVMYINGICGSNSANSPASSLNATTYNLTINVSGKIYGAGGSGGTLSTISGGNGGDALNVISNGGNNIVVFVRPEANIYGGGGGGEKGSTGANGSAGYCINYSYYEKKRCRSCPDCNGGDSRLHCYNRQGRCSTFYQYREIKCRHDNYYSVVTGYGGEGGNGAKGRGYDNQTNSLLGIQGSLGTGGGCPGYNATGDPSPSIGYNGETGGAGGDWGTSGSNTNNTGSGGIPGRAITGSNYSVDGIVTVSTIKGLYKPQE